MIAIICILILLDAVFLICVAQTDKSIVVTACVSNTVWLEEIAEVSMHNRDSLAGLDAVIKITLPPSLQKYSGKIVFIVSSLLRLLSVPFFFF